ncbi:MAG: HAD family hydrolase, partial [Gammaproteobacteria bacterium]|nr:HAD family hydrolase [Gammaproteobacteria bacterium]
MQLKPLRIAMWSGPRNISTAMMRAFENRSDCTVWDEPLYGYYLDATGIAHPGAAEVIADQGTDAAAIIARCIGDIPGGKPIFYQKHMTLHLLPQLERGWLAALVNCFLIREPEADIASYAAVRADVTLADIG